WMVSRAIAGSAPDESVIKQELAKFKDASKVADWARSGVAKAAQAHILVNYPQANEIDSEGLETRAGAAAMLYELQEYFYKQNIAEKVTEAEQAQTSPGSGYAAGGSGQSPGSYATAGGGNQSSQQGGDGYGGGPDQAFSAGGSYCAQGWPCPSEPTAFAGQAPAYQTPAGGYAGAPPAYQGQQPAYPEETPVYQGQVAKSGAPGAYLQGGATVVEAGTRFRATLNNTLSSAHEQ